jgi:hypothetical protein
MRSSACTVHCLYGTDLRQNEQAVPDLARDPSVPLTDCACRLGGFTQWPELCSHRRAGRGSGIAFGIWGRRASTRINAVLIAAGG